MKYKIIEAKLQHAKPIYELVKGEALKEILLPRSLPSIYDSIRDFVLVIDADDNIMGCCALHFSWSNLAEIRSLVVKEEFKMQGCAKAMVSYLLKQACNYGAERVFALTYVPKFFYTLDFCDISKDELPHKIWSDCINCHKFPDCDELAVAINI